MKGLLVLGPGRSGKTTLTRMVAQKHRVSSYHMDDFINAFQDAIPELGIRHFEHGETELKFTPFLKKLIDHSIEHGNIVVEGSYVGLSSMMENYADDPKFKIVVLGSPNAAPRQMLAMIRKYDTDAERTYYMPDDVLLERLKAAQEYSRQLFKDCETYGIAALDTFGRNRNKVLRKFVRTLRFDPPPAGISEQHKTYVKACMQNFVNGRRQQQRSLFARS